MDESTLLSKIDGRESSEHTAYPSQSLQLVRIVSSAARRVLVLIVVVRTARHLLRIVALAADIIIHGAILAGQLSWHSLRETEHTNVEFGTVGRMRMSRLDVQRELLHMLRVAQVLVGAQNELLHRRTLEADDRLGGAGRGGHVLGPVADAHCLIEDQARSAGSREGGSIGTMDELCVER